MPRGKRSERTPSAEPTRSSRRLRASEEPENASPLLKGLEAPKRKSRVKTAKVKAPPAIVEESENPSDSIDQEGAIQPTTESADESAPEAETLYTGEPKLDVPHAEVSNAGKEERTDETAGYTLATDAFLKPFEATKDHAAKLHAILKPGAEFSAFQGEMLSHPIVATSFLDHVIVDIGHDWKQNEQFLMFVLDNHTDRDTLCRFAVDTFKALEDQKHINRSLQKQRDRDHKAVTVMAEQIAKQERLIHREAVNGAADFTQARSTTVKRRRNVSSDEDDDDFYTSKIPRRPMLLSQELERRNADDARNGRQISLARLRRNEELFNRGPMDFLEIQRARKHEEAVEQFSLQNGRSPTAEERSALPGAPKSKHDTEQVVEASRSQQSPTTNTQDAKPASDAGSEQPTTPSRGFVFTRMAHSIGSGVRRMFALTPRAARTQQQPPVVPASAPPNIARAVSPPAMPVEESPTERRAKEPSKEQMNAQAREQAKEQQTTPTRSNAPTVVPVTPTEEAATEQSQSPVEQFSTTTPSPSAARASRPSAAQRYKKMKAVREQKEAAEAAARQAEEDARIREEAEKQQERQRIDRARLAQEAAYIRENHPPFELMREYNRRKQQNPDIGIKRKVRADALTEIPRARDGSMDFQAYVFEDSDGEDYFFLDRHGYLDMCEETDIVWNDTRDLQASKRSSAPVDPEMQPPTAKKVRFAESLETGPTPSRPSWQTNFASPFSGSMNDVERPLVPALIATTGPSFATGDPHHAQPYIGSLFNDNVSEDSFREDSVADPSPAQTNRQSFTDKEAQALAFGQKYHVWTGPKVVPQPGQFVVPDDSDDETELESNRDTSMMSLGSDGWSSPEKAPSSADAASSAARASEHPTEPETPKAKTAVDASKPCTATALNTPSTSQADSEALARARSQAEKYKPRTPSALRASSRLVSSPLTPSDVAQAQEQTPTPAPAAPVSAPTDWTAATVFAPGGIFEHIAPAKIDWPATTPLPFEHLLNDPAFLEEITDFADSEECNSGNAMANAFATLEANRAAGIPDPSASDPDLVWPAWSPGPMAV